MVEELEERRVECAFRLSLLRSRAVLDEDLDEAIATLVFGERTTTSKPKILGSMPLICLPLKFLDALFRHNNPMKNLQLVTLI